MCLLLRFVCILPFSCDFFFLGLTWFSFLKTIKSNCKQNKLGFLAFFFGCHLQTSNSFAHSPTTFRLSGLLCVLDLCRSDDYKGELELFPFVVSFFTYEHTFFLSVSSFFSFNYLLFSFLFVWLSLDGSI